MVIEHEVNAEIGRTLEVNSTDRCKEISEINDERSSKNSNSVDFVLTNARKFHLVDSGPTRGSSILNLVYTNVHPSSTIGETFPPLETENGVTSDHKS